MTDLCLTDDLYPLFRDILINRAGLYYPERKRDDLAYGLNQAAKARGYHNLRTLYDDILKEGPVWNTVVEYLTVGETYFFRNEAQFAALRQHILPDVIQRQSALKSMRIWSAGCATGEEPYSLAMMIHSDFAYLDDWQVSILATDINVAFLQRAREAVYSNWSFRETPDALRSRFFIQEQNRWRLRPEVARRVTFTPLNLVEESYPSVINGTCALDIILCRNVMIYFDETTIRQVVGRLYRALSPGGWLLVGHAEPQASIYHQFEVHNFPHTVIYRKALHAPLFAFNATHGVFDADTRPALAPSQRLTTNQTQPLQTSLSAHRHRHNSPISPDAPLVSSVPQPGSSPPITTTNRSSPPHTVQQLAPTAMQPDRPRIAVVDPMPSALWATINARLALNDRQGAEELLHELLRREPAHIEGLLLLGRLYADRGAWDSAHQQCSQALGCDPLVTEAHFLQAQIYEHQGQLEEALSAYRRTVYLDRTFVAGLMGMANIWRKLGRTADALRTYRNIYKQLRMLAPDTPILGTDGGTAGEVAQMVDRYIQALSKL